MGGYLSVEIQLTYTTAPANWAKKCCELGYQLSLKIEYGINFP